MHALPAVWRQGEPAVFTSDARNAEPEHRPKAPATGLELEVWSENGDAVSVGPGTVTVELPTR